MKSKLVSILLAVFGAGLFQAPAQLNSNLPPSGNFSLTNWYLTLPIGETDNPTLISPSQLVAGFTNAYFYTGPDGAMTFWVPADGVTTSGSSYPRSELREEIDGLADDNVDWTIGQFPVSELKATVEVQQYPNDTDKQRVIIGQIHGPNFPVIKLVYDHDSSENGNGVILAQINQNTTSDDTESDYYPVMGTTNFTTNMMFSYDIKTVYSGSTATLYVSINSNTPIAVDETDWINGSGNGLYFKAGAYCQEATNSSSIGGRVAFHALSVTHGSGAPMVPTVTTQPTNQTVTVGQNAAFSVVAGGTATLGYQWYFNTNTVLANATNAALAISDAQLTNAGNYSVVVTNSIGSVTSSVAVLAVTIPTVPVITSQPQSQTLSAGQSVTFTVAATGAAPLSYQWRFNSAKLAGATTNSLTIAAVQTTNAGDYDVIVTNSLGSVTSSVAVLAVNAVTTNSGVILDEKWLDGTRTNTSLPTDAAWYAITTSTLVAATNVLTGIATSGSPTWWTYFTTNAASPVQLAVGDTLKVTLAFSLTGVNTNNGSRSLRLGLFDSSGNARQLADGSAPNGTNVMGYMLNMNIGQTFDLSDPFELMQRTEMTSGSLISSSSPYTLLNSGGPATGSDGFSNEMPYTLVFSVTRGTNQVIVTAQFSDTNNGSFSLTATNSTVTNLAASFDTFAMRSSVVAQTATNFIFTEFKVELIPAPPMANTVSYSRPDNTSLKIAIADLLTNATDAAGLPLVLTAVGVSTNGVTLVTNATYILYANTNNVNDMFTYTVSDGFGDFATGVVLINIVPVTGSNSVVALLTSAPGPDTNTLEFAGVPGDQYIVQFATNLTTSPWFNFSTNIASSNGLWTVIDPTATNAQRFYRVQTP